MRLAPMLAVALALGCGHGSDSSRVGASSGPEAAAVPAARDAGGAPSDGPGGTADAADQAGATSSPVADAASPAQDVGSAALDPCGQTFVATGRCPEDRCVVGCGNGPGAAGCPVGCTRKPCDQFTAASCPSDYCLTRADCDGVRYCDWAPVGALPSCLTAQTTAGLAISCCAALVPRCGAVVESRCDRSAGGIHRTAVCLPCGNGSCDPGEDACNCPEDCR